MTGHDRRSVETVGLTVSNRPATTSGADVAVRVTMACAVAAVAGVAAWTSYLHTVAVVTANGEDTTTAQLVPVTTDGLIVAAGLVLLHSARSGRPAPVGQPDTPPATGRPRLAAVSDSDPGPDTASDTALASVRSWLADDPDMSGAEIARRLGYSARTGQRLRAAALGRR